MKTEGDSRRKLSERMDPGASVGCYIEQGFRADAIQYRLRSGVLEGGLPCMSKARDNAVHGGGLTVDAAGWAVLC